MKVKIDIDTRTFVRFWLVLIGFAFVILALYSARTALVILATAFFLALALNQPVNYIAKQLPHRSRIGGTAVAYVGVVAFLAVFIFLVVPPIIQQTSHFIDTIPALTDKFTRQRSGLSDFITQYNLQPQVDNAISSLKDNFANYAANFGRNAITSLSSLAGFMTATLLVLVLAFLMLVEGPTWMKRIWGTYHDREKMEYHKKLSQKMYQVVTGYVTGQLTVSAIGAVIAGFVVFVISLFLPVPSNLALPTVAVTFVLSLIPLFGATVAGVLVFLLLLINNPTAAFIYIVFFVVYQQVENNYVSPAIQSRTVELSALAVLASVTIGLYVFGLAGGIVSIPIAGSLKVLIEDRLQRSRDQRKKDNKPLAKLARKVQGES